MSSAAIRRMSAVLGTGVLGIFLLSAPVLAGPGNDHQKSSNGSTQGASHSNPDGGGVDKPYAAAGQEARSQGESDWDGNNGCGNDDDREDDNNGWCGRKPDHEPKVKAAGATDVKKTDVKTPDVKLTPAGSPAQVMGVQVEAAVATTTAAAAAAPAAAAVAAASDTAAAGRGPEVLGVQVSRGEALAATGVPVLLLVFAGLALVFGGAGLRRWAVRQR